MLLLLSGGSGIALGAALAGSSSLSATASTAYSSSASLSASATLSAVAATAIPTSAAFAGISVLTSSASLAIPGSASLASASTLAAALGQAGVAQAALTATATLTASARQTLPTAAALSAVSALIATASGALQVSASLSCPSTLAASPRLAIPASAFLAAVASLSVSAVTPANPKPTSPALQPANILATGLERCFLLDEGSGSVIHDYSGNAADLTSRTSGSTAEADWNGGGDADPTFGTFIRLSGDQDAVGSDDGLPTGVADRAVAIIFRSAMTDDLSEGTLLAYGNGGDGTFGAGLGQTTAFPFTRGLLQATTFNHNLTSTSVAGDAEWHIGVASESGGTVTFWDDAEEVGTGTIAGQDTILGGALAFFLGQLGGGNSYFRGDIAGAQVWSISLDQDKADALQDDFWQAVRPGDPAPTFTADRSYPRGLVRGLNRGVA